ncbi:cysteine-rich venom protein pseudechetoxin-like isoform X1 [Mytilus trossulus]|uniref:cysteine-rich venom protein pseudechetoxin-like isoform X1 n=1 Tax=Mytilus trossulus TaxID=6551 RepID=UPI003003AD71
MFRQLVILYFAIISEILVNGRSVDGDDDLVEDLHTRHKRSASCSTTPSLKKYKVFVDHTACIAPSSKANMTTAGVSDAEILEIVNAHNTYRSGTQATNMMKMSWDAEIAYIAQKWAENCETVHDGGMKRRIPGRFRMGQNLFWGSHGTWSDAVKWWYDEINHFTYDGGDANDFQKVGHYTQVVWAKSIKIGCGYVYCQSDKRHLFVCNYGPPGNGAETYKPYKQGTSCQDCQQGRCVNNLCDCDKICLNGGNLNISTCTCNCKQGYDSPDCSLNCTKKADYNVCKSWGAGHCNLYGNVPTDCPHMCNLCPNSGVDVVGVSDGKGVFNFDLSQTTDGGGSGAGGSGSASRVINHTQIICLIITLSSRMFLIL